MNNKELKDETEVQQSKTAELLLSAPLAANPLLAAAFIEHVEIIRKKFPVSVSIEKTECNSMLYNFDRLLLKKKHYNDYCFVEISKSTSELSFTIFKSDWNSFEKIENDFMEGFSFCPKNVNEISVVINTLV